MFWKTETRSLAHTLENRVFFCIDTPSLEIQRRKADRGDVKIIELKPFKGKFSNERDIEEFKRQNEIGWLENEARSAKMICILVAPNTRTIQIAYAMM